MTPDSLGKAQTRHPWLTRWHFDLPLLTGLLLLCAFGLAVLYSASGADLDLVKRQGLHLLAAFAVLLFLAQVPAPFLQKIAPWLYLLVILLLLAVMFFGETGKGAQRWLNLGIRFQPSEIAKLAIPLMLAWFLASRDMPVRLLPLLIALLLVLVPVALIAQQPDLGTALLVAVAGFFVIYFAGLRWSLLIVAVVLLGAGLTAIAFNPDLLDLALHDYQKRRVLTLLNPENDPLGAGYHIIQSKIAIGSGGAYGKGWLNGTQAQLAFLPEQHTDFIFAVLAEELGLMGVLGLLLLYLFVILRALYLSAQAQTPFGRLLSGALTLTFFIYVLVNTGMVSGLLPVVGVPLPLISYGGTSLVTILAGFGIIMSMHSHQTH